MVSRPLMVQQAGHSSRSYATPYGLKSQAHAVLAKHGVQVPMTDLFGVGGRQLLTHLLETDPWFRSTFGQRIESIMVLVATFDHEIDELTATTSHVFGDHAGYHAIQAIDGVGPITAAIFTAEIGDVTRFTSAGHLASWCGLTPRHYESDSTLRRGYSRFIVRGGSLRMVVLLLRVRIAG